MFVGGILSRTTGLPEVMFHKWDPQLIASLILEVVFLALWVVARFGTRTAGTPPFDGRHG
ncbi:MAG: hypothetical protein DLM62_07885 [Pseudonocardiales bacterium]|nr:MAG: hypothetical protein DLM62_07885 [Pseudonocardiales bacterium]